VIWITATPRCESVLARDDGQPAAETTSCMATTEAPGQCGTNARRRTIDRGIGARAIRPSKHDTELLQCRGDRAALVDAAARTIDVAEAHVDALKLFRERTDRQLEALLRVSPSADRTN
jgi:hypothetical protein